MMSAGPDTSPAADPATGEKGDDGAKDFDGAIDDGGEDAADAGDNCHDAVSNGSEHLFYARHDGTHFVFCVFPFLSGLIAGFKWL